MLDVTTDGESIHFGRGFSLNFQRTLRIPDDGKTYPLPPGLGAFQVYHVRDYADKLPQDWVRHGGVFIPMYQREALWINFNGEDHRPHAVKVAAGKINAVSGEPWNQELTRGNNDYLVSPPQPWLDGFNAGEGFIKQFVAMPLGMGYTVEGQLTAKEEFGGLQIIIYAPKPGRFYDGPVEHDNLALSRPAPPQAAPAMGLGAGGKMKQKIYRDKHGIDTWDQENYGRVYVHIINSMMFHEVTGLYPPSTPITARTYAEYDLPWFDLYDENMADVSAGKELKGVKSVKEMDEEKGFKPQQDDESIDVPDDNIVKYKVGHRKVRGGDW